MNDVIKLMNMGFFQEGGLLILINWLIISISIKTIRAHANLYDNFSE